MHSLRREGVYQFIFYSVQVVSQQRPGTGRTSTAHTGGSRQSWPAGLPLTTLFREVRPLYLARVVPESISVDGADKDVSRARHNSRHLTMHFRHSAMRGIAHRRRDRAASAARISDARGAGAGKAKGPVGGRCSSRSVQANSVGIRGFGLQLT